VARRDANDNGTDGQTDGQTDRQTDGQSATQYAAPSWGGGLHNNTEYKYYRNVSTLILDQKKINNA